MILNVVFFIVTAIFGLGMFFLAWAAYRIYFVHTKAAALIRSKLSALYNAFIERHYVRHGVILTFILCGITGALVDIDHIPEVLISLIGGRIPGWLLHSTFLILACIGCAYYGNRQFKNNRVAPARVEVSGKA